ncbi:50S ribosomal protein L4 [Candidatus Amesbacteria bacterium RIFOXYB1_FULL_44_23]|uniref:Large ribosomal subunit protein uL4 n=1 Tax=Candidatus Amesbacteria bacterium RIFOXYB1_FULL_44_23 TaxID=1797263 RepID=A0A1F4ZV63_9BACT|nr:MAG: 50S ribosomal protein L4 [Candidatus Amesbacteria bacterium RIFOXYB1_FULL_44_23]
MISAITINSKGEKGEKTKLPEAIFGAKVDKKGQTQAVRVYLSNQRAASAKTKTRAEVKKTTAKMYKQKGTGRARHGSYAAPIFVGGGIALGPTGGQNYKLKMSKAQVRQTLLGALSEKTKEGKLLILAGKIGLNKTKSAAALLEKIIEPKGKLLVVAVSEESEVFRTFRNISLVIVMCPEQLNTYDILNSNQILLTENGLKKITEIFKA